ncbi:MAG: hypothetical protein AB7T22_07320 [Calditrichaceae bacterium]
MMRPIRIFYSIIALLIIAVLFAVLPESSFMLHAQKPDKEHHLSIIKMKKGWKVVDAADTTKSTIVVDKGDKIIWTAYGSKVYMQFLDQKLVGKYTHVIDSGEEFRVTVGNLAKKGPNPYAVFCLADLEFATGDSPPKIVVN